MDWRKISSGQKLLAAATLGLQLLTHSVHTFFVLVTHHYPCVPQGFAVVLRIAVSSRVLTSWRRVF